MTSTKFIEYRQMIESEYAKACTKFPVFCDGIAPDGLDFEGDERKFKKWNDESKEHFACDLLQEEVYEALNAYQQGDRAHAIQELAQCGAVILRMMDFIESEKK